MKTSQGMQLIADGRFENNLDAKSDTLELLQISRQQVQAVDEKEARTGLTQEKQRVVEVLANSARIQVQKSVKVLTSEIRQLRRALETSQRNGEGLEGAKAIFLQDSVIPASSQRSNGTGSHRRHLAPETLRGISKPCSEDPNQIPTLSNRVAQLRNAATDYPERVQETSILYTDSDGNKQLEKPKEAKARNRIRQRARESATVARKCEACRRQVSDLETLCKTERRHALDQRQRHNSTEALPPRKRWIVSGGPIGPSLREPSFPTAVRVQSSTRALPRAYVSWKQSHELNESAIPLAQLSETFSGERRRKEMQKETEHDRQTTLRIEHEDVQHPKTGKLSADLHRRLERKFARAVQTYLVKLMNYEDNVLRRWFSPKGKLQPLDRTREKTKYFQQDLLSPNQVLHLKEVEVPAPEVRYMKDEQFPSASPKDGLFTACEEVECPREQQKWNGELRHRTKLVVCKLPADKRLDLPTINPAEARAHKLSKAKKVRPPDVRRQKLSKECDGETKLSMKVERIADSLLDEALEELAEDVRTWCGKVVDHLIDGELGINTT